LFFFLVLCRFSFGAVRRCYRCDNGHPFCQKCIDRWCLAEIFQDDFTAFMESYPSPAVLYGRFAASVTVNACPICRVVGPFRGDPETDSAQQVSQIHTTPTI